MVEVRVEERLDLELRVDLVDLPEAPGDGGALVGPRAELEVLGRLADGLQDLLDGAPGRLEGVRDLGADKGRAEDDSEAEQGLVHLSRRCCFRSDSV